MRDAESPGICPISTSSRVASESNLCKSISMDNVHNFRCPICSGTKSNKIFTYTKAPEVETAYAFLKGQDYFREIYQCQNCAHFISVHTMATGDLYQDDYVSSTYQDLDGVRRTFEKIINLPPEQSDNVGRVARVISFCRKHFTDCQPRVLDVGSGLGVFPYQMKKDSAWEVHALDPDARACTHIEQTVHIPVLCGDFLKMDIVQQFDLVTFNKVLEHVEDPVQMLKKTKSILAKRGIVYVELPDGEVAAKDGKEREEFTIDHPHIFSERSLELLAEHAGFQHHGVERITDPSGKYTIYAFMSSTN